MFAQPLAWWMWVVIGLLLALGELLTPGGFYLIFFGVGAILAGLLKSLFGDMPFAVQGLLFVSISVVSLLLFRRPLLARLRGMSPDLPVDRLIGEVAVALEEISGGGIGKAELRGTAWNARNLDPSPIPKSQRCRVEKLDGLTLLVRAI